MKLSMSDVPDSNDAIGFFEGSGYSVRLGSRHHTDKEMRNLCDEIIRRVNAHGALVAALNNIASEPMPMIGDVETCKFILRRIDRIARAALALAEKGETS